MAFYNMTSSLMARFSAELGADAGLQSFVKKDLDLGKEASLREFAEWFSDAEYPSYPWLELTELGLQHVVK
ncbi:hypothetical protein V7S43_016384 [Phytophthora oleae]|uniref:Uncharacterized protein n=1 Tax=Phytophthora oleae TaxID=2107226 RepID=A0ABD3EZZ0_9STRA